MDSCAAEKCNEMPSCRFLNISKHVVSQDKFKVTVPKNDDSEIVKPFTPSLEKWTKQQAMKEMQESAEMQEYRLKR